MNKVGLQFWTVALIFLLFDIELIFFYPFIITHGMVSKSLVILMYALIFILFAGFEMENYNKVWKETTPMYIREIN